VFLVPPGGRGKLVMRNLAVLPRAGEQLLVLEPLWALNATDSWVSDVRIAGSAEFRAPDQAVTVPEGQRALYEELSTAAWPAEPLDALVAALAERGLSNSRIGVELEGVEAADVAELKRRLPRASLLDCTNLLRLVRAVKTDAEVACLQRAATIAETAIAGVVGALGPGATVGEAAAEFRAAVAREGADFDHFAVGPRGLGFAAGGPLRFERDDALYLDFGCIDGGWFSDSGTTLCLGEPSATTLEQFAAVRDSVAAGAAALVPGERASVAEAAMRAALAQRGIVQSLAHGHGLGIEVRDLPLVMVDNGAFIRDECVDLPADLRLEENMVINLEAPLLTPGVRSVHCEQTFVVTATGSRPLIAQDREAPILAGVPASGRA
jgi:Xaa-Pro dipeptidase